jgi:Lon protease-like protein
VWMADGGLRDVGCACTIEQVLETMDDGRINIVARGTRPFWIVERESHLPYPAATVQFLEDREELPEGDAAVAARKVYAELVRRATDHEPQDADVASMTAYGMAATVDFGLEAKQGLLELRSENARLALVTRLFRAAFKRLDFVDRAQTRARSNGKVRF